MNKEERKINWFLKNCKHEKTTTTTEKGIKFCPNCGFKV